jgi:imidazolonepropionase
MNSADLVIRNCDQIVTPKGPAPKQGKSMGQVAVTKNGFIASKKGTIIEIGKEPEFKKKIHLEKGGKEIDGTGMTAVPGFIDSHTHLPFAGSREHEFSLRIQGATYQELAARGMGIQTTVKATRLISKEELTSLCLKRLDSMLLHGTTMVEAKSGYGLNLEDEIKQLETLKEVNALHPIDIIPTFLGAHEVPKEYKTKKKDYINLLTHSILPEVKKKNLAVFFDVFCEKGVYSLEETRILTQAALKAGFKLRIHVDEFVPLGGTELAAELKAASADHLIAITDKGINSLASGSTVATLLPGVSFFLMLDKKAPARKLIDKGVAVALATDFNPGSSMTESMLFIMQLGVYSLRMTIEEALTSVTLNPAFSLGRENTVGSLEKGKDMDLILFDAPNYQYIVYHFGVNTVKYVIKKGEILVKDGTLERASSHDH